MGIERQHYVTRGFLKGFTIDDPKSDKFIWVYEKLQNRRPRRASVMSIAWESYYFEQEHEDGRRDTDTVETHLAKTIDNIAPDIIRNLRPIVGTSIKISAEEKGAIAFFIGISMTRVPSFRGPMQEYFSRIAQISLELLAAKDEKLRSFIEKYGVKAEAKKWASLHPMVQLAKMIGLSSLSKNWQFFVPPEGFTLVTSDNPVIFSVSKGYSGIPVGPAHPYAELIVNLRKDLALVCTHKQGYPDGVVLEMGSQEAKKFNRGIVRAAKRFVFCDFYSDIMDKFVKKYIGQEQTINVN